MTKQRLRTKFSLIRFSWYFFLLVIILFLCPERVKASHSLARLLAGRILLQVESYGRIWYVFPQNHQRYYLKDSQTTEELIRQLGLGISNRDLAKIPTKIGERGDKKLVERLKGRILLQVEEHGEAWYLNPVDGLRYYLKDGKGAFEILRRFALGISNRDLATIPMNQTQIVADYAFNQTAYAKLNQKGELIKGSFSQQILPLASLTKLMTALVLLDLKPAWEKVIVIKDDYLVYPRTLVGNDLTSEVNFQAGDRITFRDLWKAMLISSSNQATVALVESTGFTPKDFVSLMNKKARDLGLAKTIFFDVTGLDAHNVSTPFEMALLARAAFSFPEIREVSQLKSEVIKAGDREIPLFNRNFSLLQFNPDGVKTGFLIEAKNNVALQKNGEIVVVMHAKNIKERNQLVKKLLEE
jgi:hypothetical protein